MEWRPVVNYEGIYEVSDTGLVRRVAPGKSTRPGRVLKQRANRQGRLYVSLSHNGRELTTGVHCIVAAAFISPRPPGKQINHKDGNATNNAVANLEYCTARENMQHAYRLGLVRLGGGEDHHLAKLTTEQVIVIRSCTAPTRLLARVFGVSHSAIMSVRNMRSWRGVKAT